MIDQVIVFHASTRFASKIIIVALMATNYSAGTINSNNNNSIREIRKKKSFRSQNL